MKNSGELKLEIPPLPDGFQWNVKIEYTDYGSGPEKEIVIYAQRGIWVSEDGKEYPGDSYSSGGTPIDKYYDYDELITAVQRQINYLLTRIQDRNKLEKTIGDAIDDIFEAFANCDDVAKTLHLYDIEE